MILVPYRTHIREAPMPTITLENIPPDLYQRLKEAAAANHHSISSEVISLIERGVRGRKVDPEALLSRAHELRQKSRRPISPKEFRAAKKAGRL
jgi:plasmid stability protein